jgi:hypothetical protein
MHRPVRLLLIVVLALSCLGAAARVTGVLRSPGVAAGEPSRLAAVLVPGSDRSELVVVDLDRARITRRIALRSLVTDIDIDPVRGAVVAAQTGGIGTAADDAVSFSDVRSGEVTYLTLPRIDPSQVRCVAGRAVILHSVVDSAGYVLSSVDLASRSVVATGHAPDGPGLWAAAGGMLWTSVPTDSPERFALAGIDPVTLVATSAPDLGFAPAGVVGAGDAVAVLGERASAAGVGAVVLVDPRAGMTLATAAVPGLVHGAQSAVAIGDSLVVGDWNGGLPETSSLAVLDATTLAMRSTIRVGRAPCAMAASGRDLLVVDRVEGVLRCLDVADGSVKWSVDLGARELVCSRVVIVPERTGPSIRQAADRVAAR